MTNRMFFLLISAAFYSTNYSHGSFCDPETPPPSCLPVVINAHCLLCQHSFACFSLFPRPPKQGWIRHLISDFNWVGGERGRKDQECQRTLPRTRNSVLACSFMHVFSDALHLHTSPSILSIHFSWKAQYDISWFPLLARGDSRNFMTKTSAINIVSAA